MVDSKSTKKCKSEKYYTLAQLDLFTAIPTFIKYYLVAFNILSAFGWGYVLLLTISHLFNLNGDASATSATMTKTASSTLSDFLSTFSIVKSSGIISGSLESRLPAYVQPVYLRSMSTFARVGTQTAFIQSLAVLEVIHVLLGWVRSPMQTTVMQVASRLFMIWGIVEQFDGVSAHWCPLVIINFLLPPAGSHQSSIYVNGTSLVDDRNNSLSLLRLQPLQNGALCPSVASLLHLFRPVSHRCILRGVSHLCNSPRFVTHPRLAGLG